MDRFFDRLGNVIKNFLDDEDEKIFGSRKTSDSFRDPDLDSAYAELNDYLNEGKSAGSAKNGRWADAEDAGSARSGDAWSDPRGPGPKTRHSAGTEGNAAGARKSAGTPEALRGDFAALGVDFGAPAATCKAAYKKLLKVHHPDRHAGHPGNMRKATEKSAMINAAYQRIEHWRETGKID